VSTDRYAHLRENLALHRAVTAARKSIVWCLECQRHHADESGLCPVCQPAPPVRSEDRSAA
jgi:uncharacterized paraquat-inducible protein A